MRHFVFLLVSESNPADAENAEERYEHRER